MKSHAIRAIVFAILLIGFLTPRPGRAQTRGPSTAEERARAVKVAHELEEDPLAKDAKKSREWMIQWIVEIPDITVDVCFDYFGALPDPPKGHSAEITNSSEPSGRKPGSDRKGAVRIAVGFVGCSSPVVLGWPYSWVTRTTENSASGEMKHLETKSSPGSSEYHADQYIQEDWLRIRRSPYTVHSTTCRCRTEDEEELLANSQQNAR